MTQAPWAREAADRDSTWVPHKRMAEIGGNQHHQNLSNLGPVSSGVTQISYDLPATSTADWTEGQTHTSRRQFQGQHTNGDASEEDHLKRRTMEQMTTMAPQAGPGSPGAGKPTLERDLQAAAIGGECWRPGKKVFNWDQEEEEEWKPSRRPSIAARR